MSVLFVCAATILSDANCMSEWVRHQGRRSDPHGEKHRSALTLVDCQKACEFDPHCVAVDWKPNDGHCDLNTDPNHIHSDSGDRDHYELVSRCNITSGQCFDSNVVANMNILKTI